MIPVNFRMKKNLTYKLTLFVAHDVVTHYMYNGVLIADFTHASTDRFPKPERKNKRKH